MAALFLTPFLEALARTGVLVLGALFSMLAPLLAAGCGEKPVPPGFERVEIGGRSFVLEVAADEAKRVRGLGGRTELAPDEGMLFVFPRPQRLNFVMRDCVIPIDIIFLDASGRVTATHHMPIEEPRRPDESDYAYNMRLPTYSSHGAAQFAIELQSGMLEQIDVEVGDPIRLDTERLEAVAK